MVLAEPPREEFADRQRIDRRPWLGGDAEQLVLERQSGATAFHRGIHARRIALEHRSKLGRGSLPLAFGGEAKTEREKTLIDRKRGLSQELRQPAGRRTPIQLHLPEAVPRLQIADRPPCVRVGSGKDMRNGEPVEPHLDRLTQTSEGDSSV